MKLIRYSIYIVVFMFSVQTAAATGIGDRDDALDMFKSYVNSMVQKVKKADDPSQKRKILNSSFDKMTAAFDKAQEIRMVSEKDKKAINSFKADIQQKRNELNGLDGFNRVEDSNLNNFANYVQQDLEQAKMVSISISAVLLVLIIILLLLL
ncbi:MAG TPA: hypothetical protein VK112_10605 [Fodinibius sp.]|nr:hypothetical protein [Fodinibius sp.]